MDPSVTDWETLKSKWDEQKEQFFLKWTEDLNSIDWSVLEIEKSFKENANTMSLKPGELQLPFRLMLVGGKFGPSVMEIANFIGKEATLRRITQAIEHLKS
jgi:glutamyl-tRNA synthetase